MVEGGSLEAAFKPSWTLTQASGDYLANFDWRFRGPRFDADWRAASGHNLELAHFVEVFDLSTPLGAEDELVGNDEIGLEIRFYWRDQWRHELHSWPLERRETNTKVLWDVRREILPPHRWDAGE